MFRHLLVPLDGSQLSEAVLPMAAFLADRAQARVTLLHMVERRAPSTVHGDRHLTGADEAERYLREVAARNFPPSVAVDWHVHRREISDVAHSLADHADEQESDLVVMLAHGQGHLRRWIFGTVAQQALRETPAPILLLQPAADGKIHVPFRQVLVPLDGQEEHEAGLSPAGQVARLCEAPLQLLMVVPTASTLGGTEAAAAQLLPTATRQMLELAERQGVDYLGHHVERLQQEEITASGTVARGEPADVIRDTAVRLAADLVALGTHGSAGVEAFWSGSLGQKLLGRIPSSFLLAPARQAG
jgi:nucleotide-binding universal stress UspA family protein